MLPIPLGVPVRITSPGSRVMLVDTKLTIRKQLKVMSGRVPVLAQLPVLKQLNGQIMRIDLGLHIGAQRSEGVEGLAAGPLALRSLNRPVGDVLRGGVTQDIPGRSRWR